MQSSRRRLALKPPSSGDEASTAWLRTGPDQHAANEEDEGARTRKHPQRRWHLGGQLNRGRGRCCFPSVPRGRLLKMFCLLFMLAVKGRWL